MTVSGRAGVEAIVCGDCGSANEPDVAFCGSCGAYLEWEGQAVGGTPDAEPEPILEPEPAPPVAAKHSLLDRVKSGLGMEQPDAEAPPSGSAGTSAQPLAEAPGGAPAAAPAPDARAEAPAPPGPSATGHREAEPSPTSSRPDQPSAPTPSTTAPVVAPPVPAATSTPTVPSVSAPPVSAPPVSAPATSARPVAPTTPVAPAASAPAKPAAAALAKPVPPAGATAPAGPRQPSAVKPAAEARRAPKKVLPAEDRRPLPGETVCRECGAGNAPTRKFCRRCGTDLVDAVVVAPLPWWRRLFRRAPKVAPVAGTRPIVHRRSRLPGTALRLLLTLAAVLVILRLTWAWVGIPVDAVRDRLSGTSVVNPSALTASSALDGRPAGLARDGATNTFWSPAKSGDPSGEFVEASFAQPFRLVAVQVFNGSSEQPKAYLTTARVATFLLTVVKEGGDTETRSITLQDVPGKQDFTLGISDVTRARLTVQTAYGASPQTQVALAEVAFFKRS